MGLTPSSPTLENLCPFQQNCVPLKHQVLVFWGLEESSPLDFPTQPLGHLVPRSQAFCSPAMCPLGRC